jgi:hypothetical protein
MTGEDELLRLVPPPDQPRQFPGWTDVEARLGTRLPHDYKWLVEHYGPGSFDDFLHVLQPSVAAEPIQLEHQAERTAWTLDYLREGRGHEQIPYENSELLAFCKTDNGDTGYWLRHPTNDPDAWTVVVNEARGPRWPKFKGGAVEFLVAVLSGTHRIPVFPEDFPSDRPGFAPYDA